MTATYVLMFCRIAIAVMFAWSASGKLRDMSSFRDAITDFRLMPATWSAPLAWAFLSGEVLVVLLMIMGRPGFLLPGFVLSAGLLLVFAGALIAVIRRALVVSCNCFGSTQQHVSWYDVVRNALLIVCSVSGGWAITAPHAPLRGDETLVLGMMALCFVVLVTHTGDIVETLRQPFEVQ